MVVKAMLVCVFSESYDVPDAKNFFEQNYSHVYYIFYEVFISTEADLKQRGKWALIKFLLQKYKRMFVVLVFGKKVFH